MNVKGLGRGNVERTIDRYCVALPWLQKRQDLKALRNVADGIDLREKWLCPDVGQLRKKEFTIKCLLVVGRDVARPERD
jgi:hypothetical protein